MDLHPITSMLRRFNHIASLVDREYDHALYGHFIAEEQGYYFEMDVPGMSKADINITIEDNLLLIQGERKGRTTRHIQQYTTLPRDADLSTLKAKVKDGVLTIELNKTPKPNNSVKVNIE
jgi:HSP20 family protein